MAEPEAAGLEEVQLTGRVRRGVRPGAWPSSSRCRQCSAGRPAEDPAAPEHRASGTASLVMPQYMMCGQSLGRGATPTGVTDRGTGRHADQGRHAPS